MERDTWVNWFDAPDSKDWPFQILQGMMITQKVKDSKVGEVIKKFREAGIMNARSLYAASQEQIAKLIFGVGIQNEKARYLKGMARDIIEKHGGKVSLNYKKLLKIKGVGPKIGKITLHTINQVKNPGLPAEEIAIDSHVARMFKALGWTPEKSSDNKAGKDVEKWMSPMEWGDVNTIYGALGQILRDGKARKVLIQLKDTMSVGEKKVLDSLLKAYTIKRK